MTTKVYCYYLTKYGDNNKSVYAWTDSKTMAKKFEKTRDMGVFKKRIVELDNEHEYSLFASEFFYQKLEEIPLNDSDMNDIILIGTSNENFELSEAFNDLIDKVVSLKKNFEINYRLTGKYDRAVQTLLSHIGYFNGEEKPIVDTFALFYYIFHGTFCNDPQWKPPLNNGEKLIS